MSSYYFISKNTNPYVNQALEEYLLENVSPGQCIFLLWQNEPCVFIGKNQNPWRECRTSLLQADGVSLARRISGGGTVYHDLGNLNFSFIMDRPLYNLQRQLGVMIYALQNIGISASLNKRNDIMINDQKISGSAFCFRKNAALHHGTLLLNTDLQKLHQYLQVSQENLTCKGVKSTRSPVTNICEDKKELTMNALTSALLASFCNEYGTPLLLDETTFDPMRITPLTEKFASWEWQFGETPKFEFALNHQFAWGDMRIHIICRKGMIENVYITLNEIETGLSQKLALALVGCPFDKKAMAARVEPTHHDVATWLASCDF